MSLNCLEIENFTLSLEYYNLLKKVNTHIITFTKEFRAVSIEYHKKLKAINGSFESKLEEIKQEKISKKDNEFNKVFNFIHTIPQILDMYLENFGICLDEMEKGIKSYEKINSDLVIPTYIDNFKKSKKELLEKENELIIFKNNFMEKMTDTEQTIYKYYYLSNRKKPEQQPKNKDKNVITEDYMNNIIKDMKQMEDSYKSKVEEGKNMEKEFVKNSNF
jgi:hypothetical protein